MDDEAANLTPADGPRRRTYEPPADDALYTGAFPIIDEGAVGRPAPSFPGYPEPPVRRSLSEAVILERFQHPSGGSTADLIGELERQVLLKEEEEEAFESWAQIVRNLRGDEAEPYIARQRIIFDGGDPGPEVQHDPAPTEVAVEPEAPVEEVDLPQDEPVVVAEVEPELEVESEEASLPEADEPEGGHEESAAPDSTNEESPESSDDERWPLAQTESPEAPAPATAHAASVAMVLGTWWGVGIPLAALVTGGYLSFRGLGILESLVTVGSLAVIVGIIVGVISRQSFDWGFSTNDLMARTFGRAGAVAPAVLLSLTQLLATTFVVWWASDTLFDILRGAGWWPFDLVVGQAAAGALVFALVAALALVGPRTLQVSLVVGSVAAVFALVVVSVIAVPELDMSLSWTWSAPWMTVVSAGSVALALATLLVVQPAADLSTLRPQGSSRFGGLLSAVVLTLPFAALAGIASWMAQSSPVASLGLMANPVGTLVEGAPAFYPAFALVGAVVPVVGVAAVLARSLGLGVRTMLIPGHRLVHGGVALALVGGLVALALVWDINLSALVSDAGLTLGVVAVAVAAVLAKEWAVLGSRKTDEVPTLRIVSVIAVILPVIVGLGLLESDVAWLAWQGYLFPLLELAGVMDLSPASPGLLVSFVLAGVISGLGALVEHARLRKTSDA